MAVDTKRKRGKGNKAESTNDSKRFRGSTEDRTCPHCSRVFTSELGCNYHVSKHLVTVRSIDGLFRKQPNQSTPQMVPRVYEMPTIRGWVPCSQDPGSSLNMVSYKL